MIKWPDSIPIYLHRDPVDFRKAINGLALIVSEEMVWMFTIPHSSCFVTKIAASSRCSTGTAPGSPYGRNAWKKINSNGHGKTCLRLSLLITNNGELAVAGF